ncbi:collagen-like protein [Niabella beijingensis]|uniref:collagen-like protein n=1 Tax=Niabella beijingensis TaxID=2872700 RepID=UPI001CBC8CEB|nr:collagen-like protein [Niabella beijingensis]MBZ4192669.1 collagen-like protein [Niabella beijingensis]
MKFFFKAAPVVIAATVFITACKKGDAGPQGPKGDAGEQGIKGDKGATGTANVTYSDWFVPSSYTILTSYGIKHFYYNKAVPQLTDQLLKTGTVLVYARLEGYVTSIWPSGQMAQLPVAVVWQSGGTSFTDTWSAFCTKGNIKIDMANSGNYYSAIPPAHSFRYIIIPGGVRISATGKKQIIIDRFAYSEEQLKAMPYDQVVRILNIK